MSFYALCWSQVSLKQFGGLLCRRTVRQFPGHKGSVRGVAISSDGEHLVSCGDDCS